MFSLAFLLATFHLPEIFPFQKIYFLAPHVKSKRLDMNDTMRDSMLYYNCVCLELVLHNENAHTNERSRSHQLFAWHLGCIWLACEPKCLKGEWKIYLGHSTVVNLTLMLKYFCTWDCLLNLDIFGPSTVRLFLIVNFFSVQNKSASMEELETPTASLRHKECVLQNLFFI